MCVCAGQVWTKPQVLLPSTPSSGREWGTFWGQACCVSYPQVGEGVRRADGMSHVVPDVLSWDCPQEQQVLN